MHVSTSLSFFQTSLFLVPYKSTVNIVRKVTVTLSIVQTEPEEVGHNIIMHQILEYEF